MRPIRHCLPALAVLAALAVSTGAAGEAPRGPLGGAYTQLTPEDLRLVRNATARLLQTGRPGSTTSWKNDASGNFGTMKLERSFRDLGLPCKRIDHVLQFENEADPRLVRLTFCRTGGEWRLAE
ncbi:MAG: hypothetical protein ACOC91_01965 [bacterium]